MIQLIRTNSEHPAFVDLVRMLDDYLTDTDGEEHAFYDQFNQSAAIGYVVIAFEDGRPVGCGGLKIIESGAMEVKRMFTVPAARGRGVATRILGELEGWALELDCKKCLLETGKRQPEAIGLYEKNGYVRIPNYGPYAGVDNSVCFQKMLI